MKKLFVAIASSLLFSIPALAAVDLNKASQAELETLNGVGPKKAQAIIEYRKKHGEFKSVEDLEKVPGFGKKSVDAVKKDITVGNPKAAAAGKTADRKSMKEAEEKARTVGNEQAASSGKISDSKVVREATEAKTKAQEKAKGKGKTVEDEAAATAGQVSEEATGKGKKK